jgi:ABC-type uncharacterized transport system auxiliary subunit
VSSSTQKAFGRTIHYKEHDISWEKGVIIIVQNDEMGVIQGAFWGSNIRTIFESTIIQTGKRVGGGGAAAFYNIIDCC